MSILVINSGSSSIKFCLFQQNKNMKVLAKGMVDAIGLKNSRLILENKDIHVDQKIVLKNHQKALLQILETLQNENILNKKNDLEIIGHRIVHGGEKYNKPTLITPKVIKNLKEITPLAPLHNPENIECIKAVSKIFPKLPQIAVFDTAFHQTMSETAFLYGLPIEAYKKHGLRRYGFHGINHQYVYRKAAKILRKKNKKHRRVITVHLGNGCSITAIKNGLSIENSMGYTPLEGLIMGTRSGDVDPAMIEIIANKMKFSMNESVDYLNRKSGLLGISGISSDMRIIWAEAQKKNPKALLAMDMYARRIAKYINAYIGLLNGIDGIVFTGGIGENAWYIRKRILSYLKHLNIKENPKLNKKNSTCFQSNSSKAALLIVQANEELEIAQQAKKILRSIKINKRKNK